MLLRYHGSYPEGVGWAILTMNCLVWLMDRMGMPRRFGISPFTVPKKWVTEIRGSLAEIKFVKPETTFNFFGLREGKMPGEAYLDPLRAHMKAFAPVALLFAVTCVAISSIHTFTDLDTARPGRGS